MAGPISHMFYADDSGNLEEGWIVYGWVELAVEDWDAVLTHWLTFRKRLVADYGIPTAQELHMTALVNGRGHVSTAPPSRFVRGGETLWKPLGREVAVRCLEAVRECPHIEIGVCFRRSSLRNKKINRDREAVYSSLVALWDSQLRRSREYGIVGMDGDGSDPIYYSAHRALSLSTRRIIEDPMFHSSRRSQWTQIADIVAWSGFTHLNPHAGNEFAWTWYDHYLRDLNPLGDPIELA
ncbi:MULTISPECIES: DUF3800 domain-containing protein [unclassified Microbacterium]|uniref:DUF3800 domain-containing protein n=1 Tax=unclassified Microbacterium TaxID=2609290 RepID=UPI00109CE3DE|nr:MULTISPECIES: DUF3800 domain-containing protein [unclassified Microbacterium]